MIQDELTQTYYDTYSNLVSEFKKKITGLEHFDNCPQPHLPMYGHCYGRGDYKRIAFIGMENTESHELKTFMAFENPLWAFDIIRSNEYMEYSGKSFWNFVLKFLAKMYDVEDWREIRREDPDEKIKRIAQSFVYGNMNSIERYGVTTKNREVPLKTWQKIKNASLVFDKAEHIVNVFKPTIMLVLYGGIDDDSWLTKNTDAVYVKTIFEGLDYYYLRKTDTHVYWTYHPRAMANKGGVDKFINAILQ